MPKIYFRFKNEELLQDIDIPKSVISCEELIARISEKSKFDRFELQLFKDETSQSVYKPNDVIPEYTTVIVVRQAFSSSVKDLPGSSSVSQDASSENVVHRHGVPKSEERRFQDGTYKVKEETRGIQSAVDERKDKQKTSSSSNDSDNKGSKSKTAANNDTTSKTEQPEVSDSSSEKAGNEDNNTEPPPAKFTCPLCGKLLEEASKVQCCESVFCDKCIRRAVQEKKECPKCHREIRPSMIVSSEVRESIVAWKQRMAEKKERREKEKAEAAEQAQAQKEDPKREEPKEEKKENVPNAGVVRTNPTPDTQPPVSGQPLTEPPAKRVAASVAPSMVPNPGFPVNPQMTPMINNPIIGGYIARHPGTGAPVVVGYRVIVPPNMVQPNMVQPNMIQPNMVQPNMIQPTMIQPNMIQPTMIQPNMIQPNMIQPGMMTPMMVQTVPPYIMKPPDVTLNNRIPPNAPSSSSNQPHNPPSQGNMNNGSNNRGANASNYNRGYRDDTRNNGNKSNRGRRPPGRH